MEEARSKPARMQAVWRSLPKFQVVLLACVSSRCASFGDRRGTSGTRKLWKNTGAAPDCSQRVHPPRTVRTPNAPWFKMSDHAGYRPARNLPSASSAARAREGVVAQGDGLVRPAMVADPSRP